MSKAKWTEPIAIAKVHVAARKMYASRYTPVRKIHAAKRLVDLGDNATKQQKKAALLAKIGANFANASGKVNKDLLHKYTCPYCSRALQECFKSIATTDVVYDCQNLVFRKKQ